MESSKADSAIPKSTTKPGEKRLFRLNINKINKTTKLPPKANAEATELVEMPNKSAAITSEQLAPELTPRISGLAKGLLISRCKITPAAASAAPAKQAVSNLGQRNERVNSLIVAHCQPDSVDTNMPFIANKATNNTVIVAANL